MGDSQAQASPAMTTETGFHISNIMLGAGREDSESNAEYVKGNTQGLHQVRRFEVVGANETVKLLK